MSAPQPTPPEVPDNTSTLTEKERIELVKNDAVRRWGQIVISFILVAFSLGFVGWYILTSGDAEFTKFVIYGLSGLIFAGAGAAYAIFGLGRTVGRSRNP